MVCLAKGIHARREEVSTIIDFMMVPSPLEWHKAHHIQDNYQESVGSNAMTHRNQPYLKESEAQADGRVSHPQNSKRTEGMRTTSRIRQRYGENTLSRGRGIESKMKQTQELTETSANRQRELHKDATLEPQRESCSKCPLWLTDGRRDIHPRQGIQTRIIQAC